MKLKNRAVPVDKKDDTDHAKWYLWHGKVDKCIEKLDKIIPSIKDTKKSNKVKLLKQYIFNNKYKIINYDEREKVGLVFTSNLAESTVNSLINKRRKGQQQML